MFPVYRPSGKFGLSVLPLTLLAVAVVVGIAYVYQLLLEWIPLIYINFLLTLGIGVVVGAIGTQIVNASKVRNQVLAAGLVLTLVVALLGAKFGFQYRALLEQVTSAIMIEEDVPDADRPEVRKQVGENLTFVEHLNMRADRGWSLGRGGQAGMPIQGIFVYGVWLVELGIIVYFSWAAVTAAGRPFSEPWNTWASEEELVMTLPLSDQSMIDKIRTASTVEQLVTIPIPKSDQASEFAAYRVFSVPGKEMEDAYLSVDWTTFKASKDGTPEPVVKPLVKFAILKKEEREQLVENAELLREALAEYRQALEEERLAAAQAAAETADPATPEEKS